MQMHWALGLGYSVPQHKHSKESNPIHEGFMNFPLLMLPSEYEYNPPFQPAG